MREEFITSIYKQLSHLVEQKQKIKPQEVHEEVEPLKMPSYTTIQSLLVKSRNHSIFFDGAKKIIANYLLSLEEKGSERLIINFQNFDNASHRLCKVMNDAFFEKGTLSHKNTPPITVEYETSFNNHLKNKYIELAHRIEDLLVKIKYVLASGFIFSNFYNLHYPLKYVSDTKEERIEKCLKDIDYLLHKDMHIDVYTSKEALKDYMSAFWSSLYCLFDISANKKQTKLYFKGQESEESKTTIINKIYDDDANKYAIALRDSEVLDKTSDEELEKLANNFCDNSLLVYVLTGKKGQVTQEEPKQEVNLDVGKAEEELNKLIGLKEIKESITKIKAYAKANKGSKPNLHMCFFGNPGTGKTEVARIIAKILHENDILPTAKLVEVDRGGLIGQYVGETPIKTSRVIQSAMGGVLFIDEAYALAPKDAGFDYGHEAVATLIKAMEDKRGEFCVILAGYRIPLQEMLDTNPGFTSRIQFSLNFPNYSRDELGQIIDLILSKKKYTITPEAKEKILDITDHLKKDPNFANARVVRSILDEVIMCLNVRNIVSKEITIVDVDKYIADKDLSLPTGKTTKRILTVDEELDALVGLDDIKKTVKKIRAYVKKNAGQQFNLHMCFYGNPGTGKTEVARIVSRLLYEAGALKEAKTIEVNPGSLISSYVGGTGPLTERYVKDAMGGVLFVDEAYGLLQRGGEDAVSVLLKEMEDKRGKFCVILAGYKNETKKLLASNPGFASRIQFELDFPDYTNADLSKIAVKMLEKKNYRITDDALKKILQIIDYERKKDTFANARTLRNILDQVAMNQTLRTENDKNNNTIAIEDVNEYIKDAKIDLPTNESSEKPLIDYQSLINKYHRFNTRNIDFDYLEQAVISISGTDGGQGTGFIISPDGLCLTCNHCLANDGVKQIARIMFIFKNKRIKSYMGFSVLKRDPKNDIALLQLEDLENEYDYLPLENENYEYKSLNEFKMAGFPFGGETYTNMSLTDGKVASVNNVGDRKVVFANMFGKPGNSGSPVIDKKTNKVIGVFWGGINQNQEMIPCFTPIDIIWDFIKGNE